MTRGRKPKPTAQKKREGNPGKRPLNEREPQPKLLSRVPPCPAHVVGDARKEWKQVAPSLFDCGVLSAVELSLLELYCESIGRAKQAQKALKLIDIEKLGEIDTKQRVRILVGMIREAATQAKAIASELGITPASRTRLTDGGSATGGSVGNSDASKSGDDDLFDS